MQRKVLITILTLLLTIAMLIPAALPAQAATGLEIGNAIDKGLAWLKTQQNADGSFGSSGYYLADTASAVLAMEDEGYFPGPDSSVPSAADSYERAVEKGLDYLFTRGFETTINNQTAGYAGRNDNPDTNANGKGVYFQQAGNTYNYETGMVMLAIVDSTRPNRTVTTGALAGKTYAQVLQDVVDYVAWGQIDGGSGRGGWRYEPESNNTSAAGDNSVAQWPVLGLIAAQQWGINAPGWVKTELNFWIDYVQNDASGGSGYSGPNDYVNESKTGGLLIEMYYVGDSKSTPRAQAALNFINLHWDEYRGAPSEWYGNIGHPYAMFAVFKGLELMGVANIPNADASPETPVGDWWGDYCEYLVNSQTSVPASNPPAGYWGGYWYWGSWMASSWYIVILQSTVFPTQVTVDAPACGCAPNGYTVGVTYSSERFVTSGEVRLYLDDVLKDTHTFTGFQGTATYTYSLAGPTTAGTYVWRAEMDATPVGGSLIQTESQDSIQISNCESPVVSGIPDQNAPFQTFDLDNYLTYAGGLPVTWSASAVPAGWSVTIGAGNVVTVVAPVEAIDPVTVTFTASVTLPCGAVVSGSDSAVFTPYVGFITGGGSIKGAKGTPSFTYAGTVGVLQDGTLAGQYNIVDHANKVTWHCHSEFSYLAFTGPAADSPPALHNQGTFIGHFTDGKGGAMDLKITIIDGGESGQKGDSIVVKKGPPEYATIWFQANPVSGGNLQVHDGIKS